MPSLKSSSLSNLKEPLTPTPPLRQRCPHVSRNGRRCRYLAASPVEPHCKYHLPENSSVVFSDLLEKMAHNFDTPEGVNDVLYAIFFWLADGYISERKAGVLTYIAQTVLNSQRTNLQLQKLLAESERCGLRLENPYENSYDEEPDEAATAKSPSSPAAPLSKAASEVPQQSSSVHPNSPAPEASADAVPPAATSAPVDPPTTPPTPPPKIPTPPPPPPLDLNHFYPRDPTLSPHIQDPRTYTPAAPSNRRNFARPNRPRSSDDDWKIINGR